MLIDCMASLAPAWSAVASALPRRRYFHRLEYFESALTTVLAPSSDRLFALSAPGRALVPLRSRVATFGRVPGVRLLEVPNTALLDLQDGLLAPGDLDAMQTVLAGLAELPPWDVLWIPRVMAESPMLHALRRLSPPGLAITEISESKSVSLAGGYRAVESRIGHKFLVNERRKMKKLAQLGEVAHRIHYPTDRADPLFAEFLRIEASGWKGRVNSAIAASPQVLAFFEQLIARFGPEKQCRLDALTLDDRPIAMQFSLVVDGVISLLKLGFDEEYQAMGPGGLLIHETLRGVGTPEDGLEELSFVTGAPWNDPWGARAQAVFDVRIYNHTPRAQAVWGIAQLTPHLKRGLAWAKNRHTPSERPEASSP